MSGQLSLLEPAPAAHPELFPRAVCNGAGFSADRRYRYWLSRRIDNPRTPLTIPWLFLLLNPSDADETKLDPTARRCIGFTASGGGSLCLIGNPFALVSTDPRGLAAADDPVGPRNDENLIALANFATVVIAGWGNTAAPGFAARIQRIREIVPEWKLMCLGTNKDGSPKHPLYLPASAELRDWPSAP